VHIRGKSGEIAGKMGAKKEKQPWQSQRCFPGCVLEVVCLIRRWENEKVAQVRKILDYLLKLYEFRNIGETL
jgi:hypothetical protein